MKFLPVIFLFLALILESSVFSIPLILLVLIPLAVIYKNYYVFFAAFIFGIFLDILTYKQVGLSSIFFCILVFLIFLYQKKFEITTNYFVIFASLFGSFLLTIFYGYNNLIFTTLVSVVIGLLIFNMFKKLNLVKQEENG